MDENKTCRIRAETEVGSILDEASWPQIHEAMTGLMVRLEKALRPNLSRLDL